MSKQQRVLSQLDAVERNCNIIITGLSEKDVVQEESVYKTDSEKVNEIFNKLNLPLLKGNKCLRLGKPSANYNRVLKVNVISKGSRDSILEKSKSLKDMGEPRCWVYLKKDLHPVIAQENKRLNKKNKRFREA